MSKKPEILTIGAPLVDQVIHVDEQFLETITGEKGGMLLVDDKAITDIIERSGQLPQRVPGGSAANTIKGLANLGHNCAMAGKIGDDWLGSFYKDALAANGIVSHLALSSTPTGQVLCLITPDGERTMRTFLGASIEITPQNLTDEMFEGIKHVHIEGYGIANGKLVQAVVAAAKKVNATISLDLASFEIVHNFRKELDAILDQKLDLLFCNEDEAHAYTGLKEENEAVQKLGKLCHTSVICMGDRGCWTSSSGKHAHHEAYPVKPLDTTGAGDLFASGFLHGYLQGRPINECAHYGALIGAEVVQIQGAELPPTTWQKIKTTIAP
ncbi:MAG: adenosine kinase [Chlamydiota bacterium]